MTQLPPAATRAVPSNAGVSCPNCGGISHLLEESSQRASVDYFRCAGCSEVWTQGKQPAAIADYEASTIPL